MGLRVVEVFEGEVGHGAPLLARELARRGVGVVVVCPPASASAFEHTGAEVTPLTVGTGVGSLAALRRVLRADLVHAHGLRAAAAVSLARAGATPVVVSLAEAPPVAGAGALLSWAVTRTVIPSAAAVLAPTPELVAAATRLGAREARLLPPPLPDRPVLARRADEVREELALPPDTPIVLGAARLHPDTRLDVLVEAAARWRRRDPQPQVVLAGVGPAYRTLVAQAIVARSPVTFAGDRTDAASGRTVATADRTASAPPAGAAAGDGADGGQPDIGPVEERASLAELLAAATVAVVTDPRARPGIALAAAQAGVALVVPHGGSIAGLFPDGVVTVPAGDVDALDAAVRELLDDPPVRADLVAAASGRVAGWPDAAAVAEELAGLYGRVSRTTPAEPSDTPG